MYARVGRSVKTVCKQKRRGMICLRVEITSFMGAACGAPSSAPWPRVPSLCFVYTLDDTPPNLFLQKPWLTKSSGVFQQSHTMEECIYCLLINQGKMWRELMVKVVINWDWAPHLRALFAKLLDKRMYMPLVHCWKSVISKWQGWNKKHHILPHEL